MNIILGFAVKNIDGWIAGFTSYEAASNFLDRGNNDLMPCLVEAVLAVNGDECVVLAEYKPICFFVGAR